MNTTRTKIAGIISFFLFLISVVLILYSCGTMEESGEDYAGNLGLVFLAISAVFSLAGIIKGQRNSFSYTLYFPGLAAAILMAVLFSIVAVSSKDDERSLFSDSQFLLDSRRNKVKYYMMDGYFDWNFSDIYGGNCMAGADGKFYYQVYMGGEGVQFPYCDWLVLEDEGDMIDLDTFCAYYGYPLEADEENNRTVLYLENDRILLSWNGFFAEYENTGEKLRLKHQIVRRKNADAHYRRLPEKYETFVDTDFLYYAHLLK